MLKGTEAITSKEKTFPENLGIFKNRFMKKI
jgi:hypothetical protein